MQRRHAVHRPHSPTAAKFFQGLEIRPAGATRNRRDFQVQRFGQHLEARIGQGVCGDHVARLEQRHHRHRQAMLGAADHQHLSGIDSQPARAQVPRHRRTLVHAPRMGLIAQQRLQVTAGCQLAQCTAQHFALPRQRRIVEVEIDHASDDFLLVDAQVGRQRSLPDKGAAPGFATHQAHGFELAVHPTRGHQRQTFTGGQLAVSRQAGARQQATGTDIGGKGIHQGFVTRARHGRCIHDNFLIVIDSRP